MNTELWKEEARKVLEDKLMYLIESDELVDEVIGMTAHALHSAYAGGVEDCIQKVEETKIAAILDLHEVDEETAQLRGEEHNESLDIAITALRTLLKEGNK